MDTPHTLSPSTQAAVNRRERLAKTFAYYAIFVILGLAASTFGPTLGGLAGHVGSTLGMISILFVMRSLGYLTGSLLAGRLYDRVKGHPLLVVMLVLLTATMFLVPVIPLLWLLAFVALVMGVAEGLIDVGGNTLLMWVHRENLGPFMNGLHFFFGFGAFLSPIIIAWTVKGTGDIYWAYWALALLMLPGALWISRLSSPSPIVTGSQVPAKPALPWLIALIAAFDFFYVGAEVGYGGWVYSYGTALNLANPTDAAYLTSGFWGALTVGRLLSIPIATRVRPKLVLLADLMLSLASLALILLLPGSYLALWVGTIGVGIGLASMFPTILTLAERHMTITGNITSWFFVGSSLGGMSIPWIVGQLFEPVGPQVTMLMILINIVIDLFIFIGIGFYTRRLDRVPRS